MNNFIEKIPYFVEDFHPPRKNIKIDFPAMFFSCGHSDAFCYPNYKCFGATFSFKPLVIWQYTMKGEGILEYKNKKPISIGPKTLLFLSGDEKFVYYPAWFNETKTWDFIFICLTGRTIQKIAKKIISTYGPLNYLTATSSLKTAYEIISLAMEHNIHDQFLASRLAYELVLNTAIDFETQKNQINTPDFIKKAIDFCHENMQKDITVADISNASGVSRYYFVRKFKEFMGISPSTFLRELRLNRAKFLLQISSRTIKEVTDMSGFCNSKHFSRAFKKRFGVCPNIFRGK